VIFDDRETLASQDKDNTELYNDLSRLNNELMTMQRELIKRTVELEKLYEEKNQFVGLAAHDLRNPLQVIGGYSRILLQKTFGSLTNEQQKMIDAISRNSDFMLRLITHLLHISEIDAGKLQLDLQRTDIIDLLRKNLELNSLIAEQKGIRVGLTGDQSTIVLMIDALKIEQVLNNLLQNAIKFSYPDSFIEVKVEKDKGRVIISVKDEGQGIPADEIPRLFRPFEKTSVKSTNGEPSTGLGLAIARRIVLGHKGEIWAVSEKGSGSTFYVALPINS
jgi:two-component system, OmpR family, sensor kinase